MGLEKVKFYFEPKFKTEFFSGGEGGGAGGGAGGLEQVNFFCRESNFFFGGGGRGGGRGVGVGGWTDEQAQAFKCDLGLQPR